MRIHGLMLVRDEADVIGETVAAAVGWCDAIYVFDNGSRDGTWEQILDLAGRDERVIPFKQDPKPFSQSLRGEIFRRYRSRAEDGDWWVVLDSDEIYIDDPRAFLAGVPPQFGEVWSSSLQYYFTDADLEQYEADPARFHATPVQDRLRYYLNNWSESRFMRHHAGLVWPEDRAGQPGRKRPLGLMRAYPRRIRLKHYQYRSPEQIEDRLRLRASVVGSYRHEHSGDWLRGILGDRHPGTVPPVEAAPGAVSWRDRIVPASALHYDAGDGRYVEDERALPPVPLDRYRVRELKHRVASARWRLTQKLRAATRGGERRPEFTE